MLNRQTEPLSGGKLMRLWMRLQPKRDWAIRLQFALLFPKRLEQMNTSARSPMLVHAVTRRDASNPYQKEP